ncbi:hypothetical protein RHMOL_Rhmol06G0162200 [Rhododendron molle]|uniref:Uncharacterized protein n=1 Tax=Rhododendron molle TaxID=49168 RepID=A0ACC0NDI1_RHOML|nr:hypothetical protein RHMOL_Rhmol06G0162200 [Rhododendron molle]
MSLSLQALLRLRVLLLFLYHLQIVMTHPGLSFPRKVKVQVHALNLLHLNLLLVQVRECWMKRGVD